MYIFLIVRSQLRARLGLLQWLDRYIAHQAHQFMALKPQPRGSNKYYTNVKPHAGRKYNVKRYNTRKWRKLRAAFLSLNPVCNHCDRLATVCDHIKPVRQGGSFWRGPFQALCTHCHAVKSGKERHEGGKGSKKP